MNDQTSSHRIVLIAAILTFGLGWFNSERAGHAPSRRFLIGAGVTFTALSFLSDFAPGAANALSMAVATTALFSEGSGVLSYLNKDGELNTPSKEEEKDMQTSDVQPIRKTTNESVGQIPGMGGTR
jgi:hypothetical protein